MKEFFIQNLGIFDLIQNFLELEKFEGVDFKHDNISLNLLAKNTQRSHF